MAVIHTRTFRLFDDAPYVSVASADFYAVGTYYGLVVDSFVAEFHYRGTAGAQGEMSQIYPRSSSHLLIDGEVVRPVGRVHAIVCCGGVVRQGSVTDVYGVCAVLGDVGTPDCSSVGAVSFAWKADCAGRSCTEWIVAFVKFLFQMGESGYAGIAPFARTLWFIIKTGCEATVVVYYYFGGVHIAFTRAHYVCSGILKHGHKEWYHVALCIEVFHSLEYACALPFPTVEFRFKIPSVALP